MIFTLDMILLSLGCVYGVESLVKQTAIFKGIESTVGVDKPCL